MVEDLGGGHVSTVTYGSKDPDHQDAANLCDRSDHNPTLGQILNQVRGEQVRVSAPNEIEGVILGVETRARETGKDTQSVEVEMLEPADRRRLAERSARFGRACEIGQ